MSFAAEIAAARERMAAGELDAAMARLERAHVIGQRQIWPHVLSHWLMLKIELQRGRYAAACGQLLRVVLGAIGSALGLVPTGNTGGSDISMFKRMPISPELQAAIDAQPSNRFKQSALVAWGMVLLMAVAMHWPGSQNLLVVKRYPVVVSWPLLLAMLALAVLLSSPNLIPRQRATACKWLAAGLAVVAFFFVSPSIAFGLGLLTGKVFHEGSAK